MIDSHRIGISTVWNALRHESGREAVQELLGLGFDLLELNVHMTESMIEEVREMVEEGLVRVCSLHNYCPVPPGADRKTAVGNSPALSAPSESERRAAVAQTKHTIDWAMRLGASAVVLHLGFVPMDTRQREAISLLEAGRKEEARSLIWEDLSERAMSRGPYLDSAMASLRDLSAYAEAAGIKLGLETRYYYFEIPMLDEFQMILKNVPSPALGYWHDMGHAHVMETLGIASHEDYLKKYGDRLVGIHVHDAVGGSDHQALGKGQIDFTRVLAYIKPDTHLVLEVHGQASPAELVCSRDMAQHVLDGMEEEHEKTK